MVNEVKRYELRLYDRTLMEFSVSADGFGNLSYTVDDQDLGASALYPVALMWATGPAGTDPASVGRWLSSRTIPKNRRFATELLNTARLSWGDTFGLIDLCMGLSLNDAFWVVPAGFSGRYADFNLFDNEMDAVLSLVAYTGYTDTQHHDLGLSSEWTTNGQYPKAWRKIDGGLYLYKGGTEGYANSGMEPYSEYFASQAASALGVDHVAYDLERWHGKLASTCEIMHGPDTSLVTFYEVFGTAAFPETLAAAASVSEEAFDALCDMLVFDALVVNTDRHGNNYGFLRDNATGAVTSAAPLFDHNRSLFFQDMRGDYPTWASRGAEERPVGSNLTFDEVLPYVIQERHFEGLRRMVGFGFSNHKAHPVAEDRLDALNRFVSARVRQMLSVRPIPRREVMERIEGSLREDVAGSVPRSLFAPPGVSSDPRSVQDAAMRAARAAASERGARGGITRPGGLL